jgi:thiamine biosynthesis protein ThiI
MARRIGTYETSILPYEDCCSLFVPRHPATRAKQAEVERAEARLDVAGLTEQVVAGIELIDIQPA